MIEDQPPGPSAPNEDTAVRSDRKGCSRVRSALRRAGLHAAVALVVGGVAVGVGVLIWPAQVEEAYGQAQIAVGGWRIHTTNETPLATLGVAGDMAVLNRCDGTFTEMTSYHRDGVPSVWAAHNNCGGDVILPLEIGDQIDLSHDGSISRYQVIDVRETPKVWVNTTALIGLKGELALQSCFYGDADVPMKFIGLERANARG